MLGKPRTTMLQLQSQLLLFSYVPLHFDHVQSRWRSIYRGVTEAEEFFCILASLSCCFVYWLLSEELPPLGYFNSKLSFPYCVSEIQMVLGRALDNIGCLHLFICHVEGEAAKM